MDHYQCDLYYIPKTWAYRSSGSTELFPQHCQMPNMIPHQHFWALTDKLAKSTAIASATTKGQWLIKLHHTKINNILHPPESAATPQAEQRVREEEQNVIEETPILTIPQIMDTLPIMQAQNAIMKQVLKNTPWLHQWLTLNNTPGGITLIRRVHLIPNSDTPEHLQSTEPTPQHQQCLLRTQPK